MAQVKFFIFGNIKSITSDNTQYLTILDKMIRNNTGENSVTEDNIADGSITESKLIGSLEILT